MKLLADLLREKADDIDAGNSNLSESELTEILETMRALSTKNERLSKDQACIYLKMSRSTFDTHIRNGEIPKGQKIRGLKELSWNKIDLDLYKNKLATN